MTKHTCHWPGCTETVPPAMWGCRTHWFKLPAALRKDIWRTYKRGQEITKTPSAEYLAAATAVRDWILQQKEAANLAYGRFGRKDPIDYRSGGE